MGFHVLNLSYLWDWHLTSYRSQSIERRPLDDAIARTMETDKTMNTVFFDESRVIHARPWQWAHGVTDQAVHRILDPGQQPILSPF
jgi:hypothetical protein